MNSRIVAVYRQPRGLVIKSVIFWALLLSSAALGALGQEKPGFQMLVMGDSVVWGQGLRDENKFTTIVSREIEQTLGRSVKIVNKSHSGAAFRPVDKSNLVHHGEIPSITPTLWQQLDAAVSDYDCEERLVSADRTSRKHFRCSGVDLVLFDGGINDIGVPMLLNPLTPESAIKKNSRKYCYEEMKAFLDEVLATFDKATVVVTGYFPIICTGDRGTDPHVGSKLFMSFLTGGKNNNDIKTRPEPGKRNWLADRMSKRSSVWKNASDGDLKAAVNDANKQVSGSRAIFAKIEFQTQECYGGEDTNLFHLDGFDAKRDPITDDQMLSYRVETACPAAKSAMKQSNMSIFSRFYHELLCEPAGAGHPNVKGSRKYADSIIAELRGGTLLSQIPSQK